MKILVFSDSHGDYDNLEKAVLANSDVDMIIHLGDGEREYLRLQDRFGGYSYRFVRGNNDFHCDCVLKQYVELGSGHKALICHGHYFYVRSGVEWLIDDAKQNGCDIVMFGHTHKNRYEVFDGIHLVNPGSTSLPRGGDLPSYALVEVRENVSVSIKNI